MSDNQNTSKQTTRGDSTQRGASGDYKSGDNSTIGSNRRRFLLGVGAATALLAGCVSNDGGGGDGGGDDGTDNGSDDGTDNGSDDGTDDASDNGTDNGSDDGADDGSSDDGSSDDGTDDGSSDDGTDDGSSDDGTDDGSSDDGSSDDGTDDGSSDDGEDPPSDEELAQQFADSMAWQGEEDWRMVWTDESQGTTGEYIYHGSDFHISLDAPEGKIEWYLVDNTYYFVEEQSGQCLEFGDGFNTVPSPEEGGAVDAEGQFSDPDPDNIPEIEQCGTDSVDGDPVTCWEIVAPTGQTVRYYLLDSGRPRRIEAVDQGFVIDFFDWGSTDPISPPDMQCESPY